MSSQHLSTRQIQDREWQSSQLKSFCFDTDVELIDSPSNTKKCGNPRANHDSKPIDFNKQNYSLSIIGPDSDETLCAELADVVSDVGCQDLSLIDLSLKVPTPNECSDSIFTLSTDDGQRCTHHTSTNDDLYTTVLAEPIENCSVQDSIFHTSTLEFPYITEYESQPSRLYPAVANNDYHTATATTYRVQDVYGFECQTPQNRALNEGFSHKLDGTLNTCTYTTGQCSYEVLDNFIEERNYNQVESPMSICSSNNPSSDNKERIDDLQNTGSAPKKNLKRKRRKNNYQRKKRLVAGEASLVEVDENLEWSKYKGEELIKKLDRESYQCLVPGCSLKPFKTKCRAKSHILHKHLKLSWQCPIVGCQQLYDRKDNILGHIKKKHPERVSWFQDNKETMRVWKSI